MKSESSARHARRHLGDLRTRKTSGPDRLHAGRGCNEILFSHAAVWEMLNKVGRGGLLVAGNSVMDAYSDIRALGMTLVPVTMDHILAASSLPDIHRDPYDRMYIAQALAEGVPLVTVDPDIWKYALETIWT